MLVFIFVVFEIEADCGFDLEAASKLGHHNLKCLSFEDHQVVDLANSSFDSVCTLVDAVTRVSHINHLVVLKVHFSISDRIRLIPIIDYS